MKIKIVLLIMVLLFMSTEVFAARVLVGMTPVFEAYGYRIYWGTSPGKYTNYEDYGPDLDEDGDVAVILYDVPEGVTRYYVATAFSVEGGESIYSPMFTYALPPEPIAGPPEEVPITPAPGAIFVKRIMYD